MPKLFPLEGLRDFEEDFLMRGLQSHRDATTAQGRALSTSIVES